jgi:hypothetical protein
VTFTGLFKSHTKQAHIRIVSKVKRQNDETKATKMWHLALAFSVKPKPYQATKEALSNQGVDHLTLVNLLCLRCARKKFKKEAAMVG